MWCSFQGRKPSCSIWMYSDNGVKIFCFITLSISFATQEVNDIGRYELSSIGSFPVLRSEITVALFHSDGIADSMTYLLNSSVNSTTNASGKFFNIKLWIPSGPVAPGWSFEMVSLPSRELKRGVVIFLGLGWWGVCFIGVGLTTFRNFSKKRLSSPLVEYSVVLPFCISAGMGFLLILPEKIWKFLHSSWTGVLWPNLSSVSLLHPSCVSAFSVFLNSAVFCLKTILFSIEGYLEKLFLAFFFSR